MLIVGAKGFAKEVLEVLIKNGDTENLSFYDDISKDSPDILYDRYPICKSINEAKFYFANIDNRFTIGIGSPSLRSKLNNKMTEVGGKLTSVISNKIEIGSLGVIIAEGVNILPGAVISNDVSIGRGSLIYFNSVITHDVKIGEFVEVSPSVNILGRAHIGSFTQIGSNAVIFPDIKIGSHCVIAAGAVVRHDVADYSMVAGVPAILKKHL